jgi:hypothetical protein
VLGPGQTHPPRSALTHVIAGAPRPPLYRRLARKEARLREDQFISLSRLVRILARRRVNRSGPRLTENTLIRVAIDLLVSRADQLERVSHMGGGFGGKLGSCR